MVQLWFLSAGWIDSFLVDVFPSMLPKYHFQQAAKIEIPDNILYRKPQKIQNKVKANQIRGREFPVGLDNINCITRFWQNQPQFAHFSIVIPAKSLSRFCEI